MEKYLKSEIINEQVTESLVTHYSEGRFNKNTRKSRQSTAIYYTGI